MVDLRVSSTSALLAFFALAACHSSTTGLPGDPKDHRPWSGIAPQETVHAIGTEPFWNAEAGPKGLTYLTAEDRKGETVAMTRFAGRGGVSFSGTLAAGPATLAVTPGECSDGMSDARYPLTVTLRIRDEIRQGCGWTARQPRSGAKQG